MNILNYNDMTLIVLRQTEKPAALAQQACSLTQKRGLNIGQELNPKLFKYLLRAEHTSVLEHNSLTLLASGISRSLLAQITRERHFSFTSASQHYQDYTDYPVTVSESDNPVIRKALIQSHKAYKELLNSGFKKEEARQVLPNAATVNLLITANARALVHFLRTRLCYRNVEEMQIFANKLLKICIDWWPTLFLYVGPPCFMDSICNQGKMQCNKGPWHETYRSTK